MEAPFQIVGCLLSSKPAEQLVDGFVAQVRRERAVVTDKTARGATFVRFNAPDAKLVTLACEALVSFAGSALRFGFASGVRDRGLTRQDALSISNRSMAQARDLAAAARRGEVLVSPQLAVLLVESGFTFETKEVRLSGGRTAMACSLHLASAAADGTKLEAPSVDEAEPDAADDARAHDAQALESIAQEPALPGHGQAPVTMQKKAAALGSVFQALLAQAEEMARKQGELEARQDAMLGQSAHVDEGAGSATPAPGLEADLDAQLARLEERLGAIGRIEERVDQLQRVSAQVEQKLTEQLARRSEVESLKSLCDTLLTQVVDAQHKLDGVAALQARVLPMAEQVATLLHDVETSRETVAALEGRLDELGRSAEAVEHKIASLADQEVLVQAVKAEVENIRQISSRSKADLQFVSEHRNDVSELRGKVEDLIGRVHDTDGKIEMIESRRKMVEEVQARANSIVHVLDDINVNLEMLSEQRAVVDHVGEKLARLDYTVQEAHNTLRALQREREVAERIEQGIKALRARSSASPEVVASAAT
jgi:hypothetical protein